MVPWRDVTCFDSVHFRVPAFWTWQRSGKLWAFWREGEDPESGCGRLFVTHHVVETDGDAGRQSARLQRRSRDETVDGRRLHSHRWDGVAFDGISLPSRSNLGAGGQAMIELKSPMRLVLTRSSCRPPICG